MSHHVRYSNCCNGRNFLNLALLLLKPLQWYSVFEHYVVVWWVGYKFSQEYTDFMFNVEGTRSSETSVPTFQAISQRLREG